jgi:Flp pilus assembly protein TadG
VIRGANLRGLLLAIHVRMSKDEQAAQLVEFAVSLPLLVLFVVGIFDFSGAFTLKQKLTNIARDASRIAAAEPANDLGSTFASGSAPASVVDAFYAVDNYLIANHVADCGVAAGGVTSLGSLTWRYRIVPTAGAPCGITLIINRGYVFPANSTTPPATTCASQAVSTQTAIVCTCVSIEYSYSWKFGRVSSMFGRNTALPPQIAGVAVAMNEN